MPFACDAGTNIAHADDTYGLALQLDAEVLRSHNGAARAQEPVKTGYTASDRERQCESHFSDSLTVHARGTAHGNAPGPSCADVNRLVAHPLLANHLDVAGPGELLGCHRSHAKHDSVRMLRPFMNGRVWPADDVGVLPRQSNTRLMKGIKNVDLGLCGQRPGKSRVLGHVCVMSVESGHQRPAQQVS